LNVLFKPAFFVEKNGSFKFVAKNYPFGHSLASAIQSSASVTEARERACGFFAKNEPGFEDY